MGWCDCLEQFYGWVWVSVTGCGWVWVVVARCGWVGKMVKPYLNRLVLVWLIFTFFLITMHGIDTAAEVYLELFQRYKLELFAKIVNGLRKKGSS